MLFQCRVIKSVLRKGMLGGNILAQLAGFYVIGTKPITEFPQNQPRDIMTGKTAVWHKLPSKTVSLIYNRSFDSLKFKKRLAGLMWPDFFVSNFLFYFMVIYSIF